jgi:hypothetical protein
VFTNEDDDVAYESSVLHDDVPVEKGFPSLCSRATFHQNRGDVVHGCHVRRVLDDEKDAQRAYGKARENAYADARSAPIQTLIASESHKKNRQFFLNERLLSLGLTSLCR